MTVSTPTVTVTGHAETEVVPTSCVVAGLVEAASREASAALARVAALQAAVRDVAPTARFARVTTHRSSGDGRSSERQRAVASLTVEVDDGVGAVGPLVTALVGVGAAVHGVRWHVPDDDPAHRDVRIAAVEDARLRAGHYALGLGMVLGDVVALSDGGAGPPEARMMAAAGTARHRGDAPDLQLDPGTVTVRASAVLTVELVEG